MRNAARGMERPTVRMFNEYGCEWPFWGEDGLLSEEDFPLPPDLTRQVLAWTRDFALHFSHETGWPSVEQREASRREGVRLARLVQDAVGPSTRIELQHWETAVDGRETP